MNGRPGSLGELATTRDRLLAQVAGKLRADQRVVAAWLLGSFGRGEADEWSDLDLQVAVSDEALDGILRYPLQLLGLPASPILVQAGWPSTSFQGGRFWLAIYDGPVEVDWSIGPLSRAVRETASEVLFERVPVPVADPPRAPSEEDVRRQVARDLEFFWAMAPIALKYAGRGHTRNVVNMAGLMAPAYHRLWRALHAPDQLGRTVHHENAPDEADFEPYTIRFPATITLAGALDVVEQVIAAVAGFHADLEARGHSVPHGMVDQVRSLMMITRDEVERGGSSPHRHSRR